MGTPQKKTPKKVPAAQALEDINKIDLDKINEVLKTRNGSQSVDFMLRFSVSKDWQRVVDILAAIQDQPQSLCGDTEYQTVLTAAMIDGERGLLKKFVNLISMGMNQDREGLEKELNSKNFI